MFSWLAKKTVQAGLSIFLSPVEKVADAISRAQVAKAEAATDQEKMKYDLMIKGLEAKMEVLVKEDYRSPNAWMRILLALPCGILLWKILVYDKALGQWTLGVTEALTPEIWGVIKVVLGFYFVYEAANMAFHQWNKK